MPRRPVREFLGQDVLLKASPEESVRDAAIGMAAHHASAVLVCRDDTLVGIFTERDLVTRVVALGRDLDTPLVEVMTANPDLIDAGTPLTAALQQMSEQGYRHLPVIEDGRVLGLLASHHLPMAGLAPGEPQPELEREPRQRERLAEPPRSAVDCAP
jgi:CBS domain-containing protein